MQVVVTGIGLRSALGQSAQTWQKLLRGESAIQQRQPFPDLEPRPLALIGQSPASLAALAQGAMVDALADAGLTVPLSDCGIVVGSSRGYQGDLEKLVATLQSPTELILGQGPSLQPLNQQFLQALPCSLSTEVAAQVVSTGPVLAPMAACSTGAWAVAQAYELLQMGQCQQVIAGAVEAPITPLTLAGFQQMGALAQTGAYPFDQHREGFVLGEGAAMFVLESAAGANHRARVPYGQILGFGLTADAWANNRPDLGGKSAIAAIQSCLHRSGLTPHEINYIHAHGTATPLNDAHEAKLIQNIFPHRVPVSSTKGATGHTLGASGALGIAFGLMTLKHQILPPCVGLKDLEFDLDVVQEARPAVVNQLLCLSFGFGGQNGAIALGR
ncbi:MAG: beta-ketoacyl-ACP synthase [Microcoleaceae cyanobacterium]